MGRALTDDDDFTPRPAPRCSFWRTWYYGARFRLRLLGFWLSDLIRGAPLESYTWRNGRRYVFASSRERPLIHWRYWLRKPDCLPAESGNYVAPVHTGVNTVLLCERNQVAVAQRGQVVWLACDGWTFTLPDPGLAYFRLRRFCGRN